MAAVARYRDDISGLVTTGGSSTAYTVTTNQGLSTTPNEGQLLAITVHATNGVAPTLQADGGTTYPIWSSPSTPVASGTMAAGSPYTMKFSVGYGAWILRGFFSSPTNIALGAIMWSTVSTVPNSNFVAPYGQCISTTTYSAYWAAMGSPASGSCPGGQFAVIDMRGRVAVALDTLPGSSAASRMTNSVNGCGSTFNAVGATCANGGESWTLTATQLAAHSHANTLTEGAGHSHGLNQIFETTAGNGGAPIAVLARSGAGAGLVTNLATAAGGTGVGISNANAGGGAPHPTVMNAMGLIPYLRIL